MFANLQHFHVNTQTRANGAVKRINHIEFKKAQSFLLDPFKMAATLSKQEKNSVFFMKLNPELSTKNISFVFDASS